ncbi:substrate-binding domain-containing protein [Amycolatopsis sp. NPDC098790]|uniref:LacI family DNA-binding transcriptional regulator n=1 Tax=Amycolatopsis sp. NPDC098790 TaxID=3363939 RepID=UPI00381F0B15
MKRPTITDIAREAGVSKGAVSYALNGRPGVSEETRHRITRIARELGWSPSSAARALSGGRSGTIGLVLDGPAEVFFPALLDGFSQELLLRVATGPEAALAVYRRWKAERKVDGVLLTGPDCAGEVARIGLPAVVLGGPGGLPEAPSVRVDDTAGAAEALEYLAALGHRHVVRVPGAAAFADAGERGEAFTTVARRLGLVGARTAGGPGSAQCGGGRTGGSAAGVPGLGAASRGGPGLAGPSAAEAQGFGLAYHRSARIAHRGGVVQAGGWADDPWRPGAWTGPDRHRPALPTVVEGSPMWAVEPPHPTEPSAEALRRVLLSDPRPTALLCDTDSLAVAALVAATELGLSVPHDLSVVSWDDSDLCRLVRPALSAVRRPLAELGGLAASLLRDLVAGEDVGDVCASRPRLVTRGSTGPVR